MSVLGSAITACASLVSAFTVPTGSMAPTIPGEHFRAKCSNCKYRFDVAKREGAIAKSGERVETRCQLCGTEGEGNTFTFTADQAVSGTRIVAQDKPKKLKRWDVIVFDYPGDRARTFVKRVVGLPEETLSIDARGDLSVKPKGAEQLALQRKPREVQDALWMPVYDDRYPDPQVQVWKGDGKAPADRWQIGREIVAKPGEAATWLAYTREIRDDFGYNPVGHGSRGHNVVGDIRVRARVTPSRDAKAVRLSLVENDRPVIAEFALATDEISLICSGVVARARAPIFSGGAADISLEYADEHARLVARGETASIELDWDDPMAFAQTLSSSVRLGCEGPGGARFSSVRIDRDLVYVPSGAYDPSNKNVVVPEDSYFVLGDNSANAQDSRIFGFVPDDHVQARVVMAIFPNGDVRGVH